MPNVTVWRGPYPRTGARDPHFTSPVATANDGPCALSARPTSPVGWPRRGGGLEAGRGGANRPHQPRPAAGDDDARREQLVEACLAHLFASHLEDLAHARSDDLGEKAARKGGDPVAPDLPHLDLLRVVDHLGERVAVVELEHLCLVERGPQSDGNVAGDVVAADGQHRHVSCRTFVIDDHVGGAGADLDEADAELDLLRAEHALTAGESRADDVFDVEARAVHALDRVLDGGLGAGDDVGLDLEPAPSHADGVSDPVLTVDGVGAGDDVDDLAVGGDADRPACLHDSLHVLVADLVVGPCHCNYAGGVLGPEVGAADRHHYPFDALAGHALGGDGGGLDGRDRLVEVHDHAFAQPFGGALADPDDGYGRAGVVRLGDDNSDPARA